MMAMEELAHNTPYVCQDRTHEVVVRYNIFEF